MSEARLSALVVSGLTGVGLVMIFSQALRDIWMGLAIGVPVALVMGAVLALFASDDIRPKDKAAKDKTRVG